MTSQERNRYKLKQLILYVAREMEDAEYFGVTKLNKILFRVDHAAFRQLGRKLTTFQYQKNVNGPTLLAFKHVTGELVRDGEAKLESRPIGARRSGRPVHDEQRLRVLVEPDTDVFTTAEMAIIDRELARARSRSGTKVSDEEHETAAWYATRSGEIIDPKLTLVEDPGVKIPLNEDEERRASAAIERFRARAGAV